MAQTIIVERGFASAMELKIINPSPATASASFDEITTEVIEGEVSGVEASYRSYNQTFNITGNANGEYKVKINTKNVEKVLTIQVVSPVLKSLNILGFTRGLDTYGAPYYNAQTIIDSVSMYVGHSINIYASPMPIDADGEYDVKLVSGNAETIPFEDESIVLGTGITRETKKITASEIGTYVIRVASIPTPSVYSDITINVAPVPTFAELLSKEYAHKPNNVVTQSIKFTPDVVTEGDSMTGSAVVTSNGQTENVTYVISAYAEQENVYQILFTHVSGANIGGEVLIGPDYSFRFIAGNLNSYELVVVTPMFMMYGTYVATIDGVEYSLILFSSGEAALMSMGDTYVYIEFWFSLIENPDGGYFIDFSATENPVEQSYLDFDDDTSYVTAEWEVFVKLTINGQPVTTQFTLTTD